MWPILKIVLATQLALNAASATLLPDFRANAASKRAHPQDQSILSLEAGFTKVEQDDGLCDARSRQWTGKIPVTNGNSLFYWYFESQRYPGRAPTILYLTGGPAEASALPMFTGVGPCLINEHGNDTTFNPFSWTRDYNVIFVDEVAGSGFSKTHEGVSFQPVTAHQVAADVKAFAHAFTTRVFPELADREFHVIGESWGGFLAPVVAAFLLDDNFGGPHVPVNLKSAVMISAFIDMGFSAPSYYDTLCAGEEILLNVTECAIIAEVVPACETEALQCSLTESTESCDRAVRACSAILAYWYPPKHNLVNVKKPCKSFPTCSPLAGAVEKYMNTPAVQRRLGLGDTNQIDLIGVDMGINRQFTGTLMHSNLTRYTYLLNETPLRIMIVSGRYDPDTPLVGTERAANAFKWYGQAAFRAAAHNDWYYRLEGDANPTKGGFLKGYKKMWLAEIDESGHTVNADAPEAALYLVNQWIDGGLAVVAPH